MFGFEFIMTIQLPLLHNAILKRSLCYYKTILNIIDYSDNTFSEVDKARNNLDIIYDDFLSNSFFEKQELQIFLSQAMGALYCFFKNSKTPYTINEIKWHISAQEHLYNWMMRNPQEIKPALIISDRNEVIDTSLTTDVIQSIMHNEVAIYTKELTDELLKVLDVDSHPTWFKTLPEWEKNIFTDLVNIWRKRNEIVRNYSKSKPEEFNRMSQEAQLRIMMAFKGKLKNKQLSNMNLGEVLGMQTGSHIGYPSARMAYNTSIYSYDKDESGELKICWKSSFFRTAFPSVVLKDKDEQLRLTLLNLKQIIFYEMVAHIEKLLLINKNYKDKNIVIPVFFQTIITHHPYLPSKALIKVFENAIKLLRTDVADPEYCLQYIQNNTSFLESVITKILPRANASELIEKIISCNLSFDLNYLHSAYNDLDSIESPQKYQISSGRTLKTLVEHLVNAIRCTVIINNEKIGFSENENIPKEIYTCLDKQDPIGVLNIIKKSPNTINVIFLVASIKVALDAYAHYIKANDYKTNTVDAISRSVIKEQSVYLSISCSSIGISVLTCENGSTATSSLILEINAFRLFYARHGYYPKFREKPKDSFDKDRCLFRKYVTYHLLEGYSQNILDRSSEACFGIPDFYETYGPDLLNDVVKQLKVYRIDRTPEGLNKLYNDVATLEDICILLNVKEHATEIKKVISLYETRGIVHRESSKVTNKANSLMIENGDQIVAKKAYSNEMSMKIKELFNIDSIEELYKILDDTSQKVPSLKSTSDRIKKFKQSFKGASESLAKDNLNPPSNEEN
jgi:hypothetical protein